MSEPLDFKILQNPQELAPPALAIFTPPPPPLPTITKPSDKYEHPFWNPSYAPGSPCIYPSPYIERAMELKLKGIALNRSRNHIEDR